tara:strand:+ start:2805 stop:3884 length:1080 start_codon:yes stop_codon:yes gene_type:complete
MFKTYQTYVIKNFINKFILISLIFFCLTLILSTLEEISFFKNSNVSFLFPYVLTILGSPITLFEIFPFIFLISTQYLFYDLFKKDELNLLKTNGLSNFRIIKILFTTSFFIGLFTVIVFYNFASTLKFFYTDIKNNYSKDDKYLAVVTDNGLWLKDEIDDSILIIKANYIEDQNLKNVIINEFDKDFNLLSTIQSDTVEISEKNWKIYYPIITKKNISIKDKDEIRYLTSFDIEKIRNLFSNISTLNLLKLLNLKKDYKKLGYSSDEIDIHLLKLFSTPLFYGVLTILSSIIMFNFRKDRSLFFHVILGILMSVIIYYVNFLFSSLGNNGKIPILASILLPILFISLISIIGLIRINEK